MHIVHIVANNCVDALLLSVQQWPFVVFHIYVATLMNIVLTFLTIPRGILYNRQIAATLENI